LIQILSNRIAGLCSRHGDSLQKRPFGLLLVGQERRTDMDAQRDFFFDHALLPGGWASDVRIGVIDGAIASVATDAPRTGAETFAAIAVPGLPNLHCHAFQRGMASLAERRGPANDSFWTLARGDVPLPRRAHAR
jgi:cytosine/adenosine deaminase-related metal-dependent hydrolase